MPETRKHHIQARDALDAALFAALGEPVRPFEPGVNDQDAPTPDEPTPEAAGALDEGAQTEEASTPRFTIGGSSLGTYQWTPRSPGES